MSIQYRYDLVAVDPQGGPLTYSLDATSLRQGMTVDDAGRLSWVPTTAQVGTYPVTLTVTDATDNVEVAGVQLLVNGVAVTCMPRGW